MLLYPEADFRQVQDLTEFYDAACDRAETLTALTADLGTVTEHFIWLRHRREHVYSMPSLTTRTFSARTIKNGEADAPAQQRWVPYFSFDGL
jgi:hypothetical protein